MNPHALSEAYKRIRAKAGPWGSTDNPMPDLTPGAVRLRVAGRFDQPLDAWGAFVSLAPREGWLQFQSVVEAFSGGRLPEPADDWGWLLAAEAITDTGESLYLRQTPEGLTLTVASPAEPGIDGAIGVLVDKVSHLATGRAPGSHLCYRRYWDRREYQELADGGGRPAAGLMPVFAAFIGFVSKEER